MGTSISSVVKPFFSAVRSEPWDHESSNHMLHSPHAVVNVSNVCSFRTVAEIKNLITANSKRSLIVAISEGIESGSYVYMASQPSLFFKERSVNDGSKARASSMM